MLDVHPPEHTPHSWRDFLIHIATIVVGLVIAVGLEQTVEVIHHQRESQELIHNMHDESERNLQVLDRDQQISLAKHLWVQGVLAAMQSAPLSGGALTIKLPPRGQVAGDHSADRAVWPVAKANGKAAFIDEPMAEVYDRCDTDAGQEFASYNDAISAEAEAHAAETRFATSLDPGTTVHLTPAARDELARVYARYLGTIEVYIYWTSAWRGCSDAIAHSVRSHAEVDAYVEKTLAAPAP
jgi:hypothetical protein